jgi:hypothetical protein
MKLATALLTAAFLAGSSASLLCADKPLIGPDQATPSATAQPTPRPYPTAQPYPTALPYPTPQPYATALPKPTARPSHAATKKALKRHHEVTQRLNKQNKEISAKIAAGTLTQAQGDALDAHDKKIRAEEKRMAHSNDGGISKADQDKLDSQLNDNHERIKAQ